VPRIVREADVVWEGNVARGVGRITAATSGAFSDLGFSLPARIGAAEGKTSPEELLAAAHGGCFAMSLASELTSAGTPPERLTVRCTITMDEVAGRGHQIVHSAIEARAVAPGADREGFAKAVVEADEGCPFSALIRASAGVSVDARLEED
jgi:lipoyl-dependent peroxiredoxin